MLEIRPFSAAHVPQAAALAAEEYARARRAFPLLPPVDAAGVFCRELSSLCLPLSVAALEEGRLKGFLCCEEPRKAYFGTADGIYSPLWAHGAESPAVWQALYTSAARLWAENGLFTHLITVYAWDKALLRLFFENGFGLRLCDALRPVSPIEGRGGFRVEECRDWERLLPFRNGVLGHLGQSPTFFPHPRQTAGELKAEAEADGLRFFIAARNGVDAAYLEFGGAGENFTCTVPSTDNICGAYCLPAFRGSGAAQALLSSLMELLAQEGKASCGVDYETINPAANHFWPKYFSPYTYGLFRRIDERWKPL
ncbi:MAG: GNAT family N-acetyltransferase [Oscillospiraceae bacterium]|nr:GNAT family N-acetyltransferase [Oscillospiraceae bacterium]